MGYLNIFFFEYFWILDSFFELILRWGFPAFLGVYLQKVISVLFQYLLFFLFFLFFFCSGICTCG